MGLLCWLLGLGPEEAEQNDLLTDMLLHDEEEDEDEDLDALERDDD